MDKPNVYHKTARAVLTRDASLQSDDGSSVCSSVESVLELRKPDPETVLLELGFGPPHSINYLTRVPERFLQPSKLLKDIDINKFLEKQGEKHIAHLKITSPPSPLKR
ncbi:sperm-specific antigen 2 [Agrilus planipennis]|uniref:Sperm-specific antigen 2 n=1 Tax=Agrilus planipennis TaxID=224129 RepID=A0A1W4WY93_AGRPL|nr:sperm-specific antigen 2 [Agrilus planipennis]